MMTQRLFVGYPISLDLRMRLNVSQTWRRSRINVGLMDEPVEMMHESVIYLGFFVNEPLTSLKHVQTTAEKIKTALESYCSDYACDISHVCCFSQTFVQ